MKTMHAMQPAHVQQAHVASMWLDMTLLACAVLLLHLRHTGIGVHPLGRWYGACFCMHKRVAELCLHMSWNTIECHLRMANFRGAGSLVSDHCNAYDGAHFQRLQKLWRSGGPVAATQEVWPEQQVPLCATISLVWCAIAVRGAQCLHSVAQSFQVVPAPVVARQQQQQQTQEHLAAARLGRQLQFSE